MHSESARSSGVSAAAGEVINEPTVVESFGVSRVLLANERCALPEQTLLCLHDGEGGRRRSVNRRGVAKAAPASY